MIGSLNLLYCTGRKLQMASRTPKSRVCGMVTAYTLSTESCLLFSTGYHSIIYDKWPCLHTCGIFAELHKNTNKGHIQWTIYHIPTVVFSSHVSTL